MNPISKSFSKMMTKIVAKFMPDSLAQQANVIAKGAEKIVIEGINPLMRQAGAEGIVLLKNENDVLPLIKNQHVALFGRCQINYFYVGYGSGGNVIAPYKVSPLEAFEEDKSVVLDEEVLNTYKSWCGDKKNAPLDGFWGHWPMHYEEMKVDEALIKRASERNETAIFILGRAAGEDRENTLTAGSYYLTEEEKIVLRNLRKYFKKLIVVLDCGNIIDLAWDEEIKCDGLVYAFLGGQEAGHSLVDVLTNKVNPSGRLPDTILKSYEKNITKDHFGGKKFNNYVEDIFVGYRYYETFAKDDVLYPFGYGLSYSKFAIEMLSYSYQKGLHEIEVKVTNNGPFKGKEVVELYVKPPFGRLAKPLRNLIAFAKTKELAIGEEETLTLTFTDRDLASFDDNNKTGYAFSFVLEKGDYEFYLGENVRDAEKVYTYHLDKVEVLEKLEEICNMVNPFKRITYKVEGDEVVKKYEELHASKRDYKKDILASLPAELKHISEHYDFLDVLNKKITLDDFVASLSDEELEALTRGHGMMGSPYGVRGNAGAFGGIIKELNDRHVPAIITSDGPAGIRICHYASLLPCGTCLASTFNYQLTQELFTKLGEEIDGYKVDVILSPGMNIHRNPLCGRNFEYYSEDPLLSGKMAAAAVKGIQTHALAACPKHFACNNQEVRRNHNDSRVSNRALREIYLRGFEIVVKEASPRTIMSSYNKINGVWSHYNFDLGYTVLRKDWNYQGLVMTDWWMRMASSPEFPKIKDNAYRVRSNIDVYMPGGSRVAKEYKSDGTLLATLNQEGGITRGELQVTAKRVLTLCLEKLERESK